MTKEEFFEDYESLDKESQRILLGAWENTIPLGDTAAMQQKGYYNNRQEYSNAKNKNFFLGETIRGMHNVSPILQLPPSPNTVSSQFIKDTYFIDAQKTGDTNKETLIKEIIYNTRNGYTFIQDEVFEDTNKNGIFGDLGDAMDFKLLTFLSDDGNKVSEAHQSVEAKADEILLFIEKNEDLLSQRRLYAKIGKNIRNKFFDNNGKLSETLLQEIFSVRDSEADILKELLEKGTIEAKTISLENFLSKFKRMFKTAYLTYYVLGKISKEIADGLDFLKIPEKVWDPDHKEYVFDKENLLKNLTINGDKINKLENLFLGSNIKFNKAATVALELLRPKLQPIAKRWIDAYNQNITETIESIFALEENNAVDSFTDMEAMKLAFLCGIWNGFIDFLSSFFHFATMVFSANTSMIENPAQMLETLDNIIDFLLDPEAWKNFMHESYNFIIELMSSLKKLFGEENINWCKVAYFVGFGVAFVATFFIPFADVASFLGKLGKVGEFINTFVKVFGEMYSDLVQGIKKLSAEAIKYGNKAVSDIIAFFRSQGKLRKFFEKLKNDIVEWFLKNKEKYKEFAKYGKALLERTAKTYAKRYPDGKLYKILKVREAYNLYGNLGKKLVQEVDIAFADIIKVKGYKQKVMVSGMLYKGDKTQKVFSAVNFTREEGLSGKLAEFIESMHPVLKKRYELHLKEIAKGLQATPEMIEKAGIAASHGEIRAVNDLLYYLESTGTKVTDDIFKDIMGYNRYLIKEGSQPPCVHCFYLTDGVEYLKLLK